MFSRPRSLSWQNRPPRSSPCSSRCFECSSRRHETRTSRRGPVRWKMVPPFLICGAMLLFVQHMTPRSWVAGAANAHNYLITQPYVALLYFKTFFWPTGLSADYDLNPFTTTDDPRFWAGFAFTVFFIAGGDRGGRFQEDARDRFRFALVFDRASADVAFSARRSNERSPDIPSLHRTRDCDGRRSGVARRPPRSTTELDEDRRHVRGRAVSLRKRLRYVPKEQGLENRGNALARRRDKEPAQWTRVDELWQHADGERRFRRRARLFSSRARAHAAVFRALDQSCHCRRCDQAERGS